MQPGLEGGPGKDGADAVQQGGQQQIPAQAEQGHDAAQLQELRPEGGMRVQKLRQHGQEKDHGLGVEGIGQKSLPEGPATQAADRLHFLFLPSVTHHGGRDLTPGPQGMDAHPEQIGGPRIAQKREQGDGLGDDRADAQHGGRGVDHDAQRHAAGRGLTGAAPLRQGRSDDEGKIRAGQHDQQGRQRDVEEQVFQ